MGAWGSGPFENDDAIDAVDQLSAGTFDLDEFRELLAPDYLEAAGGAIALALVDIALATLGEIDPAAELDELDIRLISSQFDDQLYELILGAAERALQPDASELFELWVEAGDDEFAEWRTTATASIDLLRSVISG